MEERVKQIILDPNLQGREKLILGILEVIASDRRVATCEMDWLLAATSYSRRRLARRLAYMEKSGLLRQRTAPLSANGAENVCFEITYPVSSN